MYLKCEKSWKKWVLSNTSPWSIRVEGDILEFCEEVVCNRSWNKDKAWVIVKILLRERWLVFLERENLCLNINYTFHYGW